MVFSSLVFLFVFFPITLISYYIAPYKMKNYILLIASLFFYAWGEPTYVFLMIGSILFNYIFGLQVCEGSEKKRKLWLAISVVFNISILFLFKYAGFAIYNVNKLFSMNMFVPNIALPLGISFFTFQSVSYVIDVYRDKNLVQKNLFNLALYISLFPQLVAGPIVRYETVNEQIRNRTHSIEKFGEGINRFIIGLAKKIIISNQLGLMVDQIFSTPTEYLPVITTWIGIIAYSLQIFFDFSGYSDMAIGLGKMFGFDFLENFNYPYISQSVSEFWRRWHISLGSWFRDYVYIPLGGSRKGLTRTYINLFIVWFLTGFWHGASWTFIAWGLYFGILIAIEKAFLEKLMSKIYRPIRHIYLILAVIIGWVLFRADNFSYAFNYIMIMFSLKGHYLYDLNTIVYIRDYWHVILIAIILSTPIVRYVVSKIRSKNSKILDNSFVYSLEGFAIVGVLAFVILQLVNSTYNPFLYFRF